MAGATSARFAALSSGGSMPRSSPRRSPVLPEANFFGAVKLFKTAINGRRRRRTERASLSCALARFWRRPSQCGVHPRLPAAPAGTPARYHVGVEPQLNRLLGLFQRRPAATNELAAKTAQA